MSNIETLEKLLSFAFVMSENMVGLTKGNYDEATFIKKTYEYLHEYNADLKSKIELKRAVQRLEEIDNSNPNIALDMLDKFKGIEISEMPFKDDCGKKEVDLNEVRFVGSQLNNDFHEFVNTLEQYIYKAQEQEKALKTIKEKYVHIPQLLCAFENQLEEANPLEFYYNGQVGINVPMPLTEEEFDLLKKVFRGVN